VTFKGAPVADATVTFMNDNSPRPAVGTTDSAGKFTLGTFGNADGAIPGEHKVTIAKAAASALPAQTRPPTPEELIAKAQEMQNAAAKPMASALPAKYSDPTTTPLKLKVNEGEANDIPIELTE